MMWYHAPHAICGRKNYKIICGFLHNILKEINSATTNLIKIPKG